MLGLEVALPGVYLLFFGIAALIVGFNALLLPAWFGWELQVVSFVILSAVCVLVGRRVYSLRRTGEGSSTLNRRTDRLIGQTARLTEPIQGGRGRVAIADGWWTVQGPELPAGSSVRIVGADGSLLTVVASEPAPQARAG
nr:NfeD family protein [Aurantimonas sp. CSK15Z-1]